VSKDHFSHSTSDIRTEACAWIAQLESGDLKPADVDAFREWIQRSPRHASEIRQLARLSGDLNVLTDMAAPLREAAQHYQAITGSGPVRWRPALPWAAAFGAVFMAVMAVVLLRPSAESPAQQWPLFLTTGVGEYLEKQLPDGSLVELNTNSRIEVSYTPDGRTVRLLEGEVLFTVETDPKRPFLVIAGDKSIEAVGTAFLVRHDAASFEVTVTKGRVRLENFVVPAKFDNRTPGDSVDTVNKDLGPGFPEEPIFLRAGQRFASLSLDIMQAPVPPSVEPITQSDLRRKLAWQEGLLEFSDTPLETVIREVSRHTTLKIEISDPALRVLKFGGMFRTGDTEPLFKALENAYDIHAVYIQKDTVKLTREKRG
jgi:transmembrane sensor